MKVDNIRQLKNLIKLCQTQGVRNIEVDGIKLELGSLPIKSKKYRQLEETDTMPLEGRIKIPQMSLDQIDTDELSEEERMFYSSDAQQPQ